MFKMIFLILGLAVGFGGGVYWAHHNPDAAAKLSAEEEKKFLEAQLAITEKIQTKLDQLSNKSSSGGKTGSGFLSASQAGGATAASGAGGGVATAASAACATTAPASAGWGASPVSARRPSARPNGGM